MQKCDKTGEKIGRECEATKVHESVIFNLHTCMNSFAMQSFKGTLQCDWLLDWSPDTLFVHYFEHLPMYLGE